MPIRVELKKMKMPEACAYCRFVRYCEVGAFCDLDTDVDLSLKILWDSRPTDCPLKECE